MNISRCKTSWVGYGPPFPKSRPRSNRTCVVVIRNDKPYEHAIISRFPRTRRFSPTETLDPFALPKKNDNQLPCIVLPVESSVVVRRIQINFFFAGLAHSWGTSFSRALPSTAYPPYLGNNCGPPTFQHSNFTNIFPYNGTPAPGEVTPQTINASSTGKKQSRAEFVPRRARTNLRRKPKNRIVYWSAASSIGNRENVRR